MPRKYEVIDELIRDELREFLLWIQEKKELELHKVEWYSPEDDEIISMSEIPILLPIHKAPEDLINEYMEIE